MFLDFINANIDILTTSGKEYKNLKAFFQGNHITLPESLNDLKEEIDIKNGDTICIRSLNSDNNKIYSVVDSEYIFVSACFAEIGNHYNIDITKQDGKPKNDLTGKIEVNNYMQGSNHRININSSDNSINYIKINNDIMDALQCIRKDIEISLIEGVEKKDALETLDSIEESFKSGNPRKSVIIKLLNTLPDIASVAVSVATIISILK